MANVTEQLVNKPSVGEVEAAKHQRNGWIYRIEGVFGRDEDVPPEAIIGAWQVDAKGNICGEFQKNPNYRSNIRC
jgi:hypothetical protein